jgi:general secretion pathway protein D
MGLRKLFGVVSFSANFTESSPSMLLRILCVTLIAVLLSACASPTVNVPSTAHLRSESAATTQGMIPLPVQQSVSLPRPKNASKTETYSVVVNNVKVHDLLFALARDAKLNVDIHSGIAGYVTLNAIDQTLPQLLSRISKQVDMRFELDGPNLAVMTDTPYLRTYKIDYVNMNRDTAGTVSVTTQIATAGSGGVGGSGGAGAGGNNSVTKITNESKNHFWDNLIQNIKDILRETDKEIVISRRGSNAQIQTNQQSNMAASTSGSGAISAAGGGANGAVGAAGSGNQALQAQSASQQQSQADRDSKDYQTVLAASVIAHQETGVITVRATSRQHEKIQEFFDRVSGSAQRQVMIEATVAEVTLDNNYQQGIDWSRVTGSTGWTLAMTGSVITAGTAGVLALGLKSNNVTSMISLLETFGTVKVLSSPKISVINNQTAVLKVVDNVVYFTVKSDTNQNQTQTVKTYTTTPNVVPVGFVMNLTPQISDADVVLINVRPSISRVIGCAPDPNPDLAALAADLRCVPIIRSREMDSMLRIENGNIAVMGGLMEDEIKKSDSGIPGLSQTPILGALFTNKNDTIKKTELIIFLRPIIIKEASIQGDYSGVRNSLPGDSFFADTPNPPSQLLPSGPRTGVNP